MAEDNEALLKEIRDTHSYFVECWKDQRESAKQDTMLMANKPFSQSEVKNRGDQPLYLVDGLGQYTNQIINNIRQNPRGVNVQPKNFLTDRKKAEKVANWARGIEKESDAQAAYSTAFEGAVAFGGMGFMRLLQEYESRDTDRQVFRIARVPNHQSILPDPDCKKIDFSDMERCFVLDSRRFNPFLEEYPDAKIRTFDADLKNEYPAWIRNDDLQIAEYWKVKKAKGRLLITDTESIRESKLPEGAKFQPASKDPAKGGMILVPNAPPIPVRRWRDEMYPSVWQYHTNGVEILGETLWDDDDNSIPIYPVVGREMYVDDGSGAKKQYVSAVRYTSWAIKGMAYVRSLQIVLAQMTPKVPFMAIEGQLDGMDGWDTINTDPRAWVYYRAKLAQFGDVLLPPPTRPPYTQAESIAMLEQLHQAFQQDLQNALGMYRASVGNNTGSTSGKMVQELDKQSDQGSFHFTHNFNQSLERLWSDIVRRRAKVYDTARDVGGIRRDGTYEVSRLNDPADPNSIDMAEGDLGVNISVGPAMESETEDARTLAEALIGVPGIMERAGDLIVKLGSRGGPIVDQIAERLKPQGLTEGEISPEDMQRQLQDAGMKLQEAQAQLQEAAKMIETKQIEAKSREEVARIGASAQIEVARINAEAKGAQQSAALDAKLIEQATGLEADAEALAAEQQHQARMLAEQQDQELVKQAAEQDHAMAMQPNPLDNSTQ